jgi:hypothetical protein
MNLEEKYGGALYCANYADKFQWDVESHLLALPWETKRTARHELFLSDSQLSYSYGGKASCVKCDGRGWYPGPAFSSPVDCDSCQGSGITRPSYHTKPLTDPLRVVMDDLNDVLGSQFNAIFLNKYDDEKQHLGWHADDFEGMRQDQPIAVVSFGAEREIWLKDKRGFICEACKGSLIKQNGAPCYICEEPGWVKTPPNARQPIDQRVLLKNRSLFVMPVGYQDQYLHRIPKHDRPCGWRISLTFRSFYPQ